MSWHQVSQMFFNQFSTTLQLKVTSENQVFTGQWLKKSELLRVISVQWVAFGDASSPVACVS
jgi:hypothetical protein